MRCPLLVSLVLMAAMSHGETAKIKRGVDPPEVETELTALQEAAWEALETSCARFPSEFDFNTDLPPPPYVVWNFVVADGDFNNELSSAEQTVFDNNIDLQYCTFLSQPDK